MVFVLFIKQEEDETSLGGSDFFSSQGELDSRQRGQVSYNG